MIRILAALMLTLLASQAMAQSPVLTQPYGVTSHNDSGTIALSQTYQSIWAASTNTRGRAGCTVQNRSASNTQYIFFGPIASALTPKSIALSPGQSLNCTVGGIVLQDQVSITGTAPDPYYAAQQ